MKLMLVIIKQLCPSAGVGRLARLSSLFNGIVSSTKKITGISFEKNPQDIRLDRLRKGLYSSLLPVAAYQHLAASGAFTRH